MRDFVLITHADSQFGFMDTVAAELAAGFRALGHRAISTHLLDAGRMAEASSIIARGGLGMVVLMNGIGMEAGTTDLVRFLAALDVPVVGFFLDHPAYHHHRIATQVPRLVVVTSCTHDDGFITRFIRDDGVPVRHVHHGAARVPAGVGRPWAERDIDVLVPSTLPVDPEAERAGWRARHSAIIAAQLNAIVEVHDADPARPLHDAILEVLAGRSVALKDVLPYYCVTDLYLRGRIKLDSVRALLGQGVRVTVLSAGWPDLGDRAVRLPAVPMAEGFALMGRAKMVLNHLPPYLQSHERPLQAALCGAAAGSTPSGWVDRAMGGHALMLPLPVRDAAAAVAAALADPGLPERAARGAAAVANGQLWEDRAAEIAAVAGLPPLR